ncbi:helix-turn-helix transcriptional regulator [Kouleothrix sp.]|uniref:helix-turn-helix transcriptional regulator n=1 Tax=Kouleothrix sp. TaxID=2779161 RepID=UPI00391C78C9
MRADRLLSILLLLQVQQRTTARELAQRLEVSARTIHRDMEALGAAGVPIVAERGVGGGWSLLEAYRTSLNGLNEAEVRALFLAQSGRVLNDLGLRQAADAALLKLQAALPGSARHDAEHARARLHIDGAGWGQSAEAVPLLPAVQAAVWADQQIRMVYRRADSTAVERVASPLGLVAKGSIWYLVAAVDDAVRTYRVARIQRAEPTGAACVRPANFDLAAYWEHSKAEFRANLPQYHATLRTDATSLEYMRALGRYARVLSAEPAGDAGMLRVEMLFEGEQHACEYVLGFGSRAEVLAPPALRALVLETARQVVARYEQPSGG